MLEREPWDPHLRYQSWVIRNTPTDADLTRERLAVKRWIDPPRLSVLTPVYNTPPEMLRRMIRSIQRQTYSNWELCLVDDGSPLHWTGRYLEGLAARDPRIRLLRRARNGGIVAASNDALALATGVFVVLCDDDDELDPRALTAVARQLCEQPDTDVIYSDFDVIGPHGLRYLPMFLPDWSPELLLSIPYVAHLAAYRREIVQRVGGFRPDYEGSQDYDLALRVTAITDRIAHIPRILYHWRTWSRSAAGNPEAKPYAYAAGIRAITDHLPQRGFEGRREPGDVLGCHAVRFAIKGEPLVSIVSRSTASLDAIARNTAYTRYECVSDASDARGDHLLFLGDDLEPRDPDWLGALLEFSQQPGVGVVGGKIYQRDDLIWHAGIVVPQATPHLVKLDDLITRNYSAVTGACLMTRRDVFDAVGGFEPADRVGCVDVDYCVRARAIGQRTVFTPHARLRHLSSAPSEPSAGQRRIFREHWGTRLPVDPFYNRNFRQDAAWFVVGLTQT